MGQHPDICPCALLSLHEPAASSAPTELIGMAGGMVTWAPAGTCVTLRMCPARSNLLILPSLATLPPTWQAARCGNAWQSYFFGAAAVGVVGKEGSVQDWHWLCIWRLS